MRYFWSADLHLCHENLIAYAHRPFKNVEHMNSRLISNWNEKVSPGDTVYHIGDFNFKNSKGGKKGEGLPIKASTLEAKLNGKIIHIKGNHDRNNGVKTLIEKIIIKYGPHYVALVHDPKNYDPRFRINFTGHVHDQWKFKREYDPMGDNYTDLVNVGTDVWNFQPVTFEEIYREYKKWSKKQ